MIAQEALPGVDLERSGVKAADIKYTPAPAIRALLESDVAPSRDRGVFEPAAGNGSIIRVLREAGYSVTLAVEIRSEEWAGLSGIVENVHIGDWIEHAKYYAGCVFSSSIITNPPFSLAREFCEVSIATGAPYVAMLLRLNTLGSSTWADFWNEHPPTAIRSLRERPSFTADGKTDASEYFWAVWQSKRPVIDFKVI